MFTLLGSVGPRVAAGVSLVAALSCASTEGQPSSASPFRSTTTGAGDAVLPACKVTTRPALFLATWAAECEGATVAVCPSLENCEKWSVLQALSQLAAIDETADVMKAKWDKGETEDIDGASLRVDRFGLPTSTMPDVLSLIWLPVDRPRGAAACVGRKTVKGVVHPCAELTSLLLDVTPPSQNFESMSVRHQFAGRTLPAHLSEHCTTRVDEDRARVHCPRVELSLTRVKSFDEIAPVEKALVDDLVARGYRPQTVEDKPCTLYGETLRCLVRHYDGASHQVPAHLMTVIGGDGDGRMHASCRWHGKNDALARQLCGGTLRTLPSGQATDE